MPAGFPPHHHNAEPPVRDAACIVLIDRTGAEPRLLLGRRLPAQVFLPNKWVFPGGRVDEADKAYAADLTRVAKLPPNAHHRLAFACAAIRELYEEAGILLASPDIVSWQAPQTWADFAGLAVTPAYERLTPLARAITPPGFPRRFDTWFFSAEWDRAAPVTGAPDGELLDLAWFTLAETRALDLPIITRYIVDDVATLLAAAKDPAGPLIPFYFQDFDVYRRTLVPAYETAVLP
ncbi:MAG: NUDIX hydrolase [Hyphomicrobium sp.]|nr:NUDIX hydrolase [Hyphomicrobium sp.]